MKTLNIQSVNRLDMAFVCALRNDKKEVSILINALKDKGIFGRLNEVNNALLANDYASLMGFVWSERDRPRRLEWLRENAKMHAPLLFELAMAEISNSPTVKTINTVAFPIICAAGMRLLQDGCCFKDLSVNNTCNSISASYVKAFESLVKKFNIPIAEVYPINVAQTKIPNARKMLEISTMSLTVPLPSPAWLSHHSKGNLATSQDIWGELEPYEMYPSDQWQERRGEIARTIIQNAEKILKENS